MLGGGCFLDVTHAAMRLDSKGGNIVRDTTQSGSDMLIMSISVDDPSLP
jgi:hypothetical protein